MKNHSMTELKNRIISQAAPLRAGMICFILFLVFVKLTGMSDESHMIISLDGAELVNRQGNVEYDYIGVGPDSGNSGTICSTEEFSLKKGVYHVALKYHSENPANVAEVISNGRTIVTEPLPPGQEGVYFDIVLDRDSPFVVINFNYAQEGYFIINHLDLAAEDGFYNDRIYFVLLSAVVCLLLFGTMVLPLKKHEIRTAAALAALAVFAFYPYMEGYLFWGDDICYHLLRIEGIKDGILSGQFPVVIYPEGLNGFGYMNCMYPSLFLYFPAILRIFGVSISNSYKSLIFLANLATIIITYFSAKLVFRSCLIMWEREKENAVVNEAGMAINLKSNPAVEYIAMMVAFTYTLCPYRFTNLYARGALGEALAMTFLPLLVAGLWCVFYGDRGKWYLLALALTGLMQSHLLSFVLAVIMCVVWGSVWIGMWISLMTEEHFAGRKDKRFIQLPGELAIRIRAIIKAAVYTAVMNLGFLVPFVYHSSKVEFSMSSLYWSGYSEYSLNPVALTGTLAQGFRNYAVGVSGLLMLALTVCFLAGELVGTGRRATGMPHTNGRCKIFVSFMGITALVMIYLCIYTFPAGKLMALPPLNWLFSNIQFPWRLLGMVSILAMMAGGAVMILDERWRAHAPILCLVLAALAVWSAVDVEMSEPGHYAYRDYKDSYTIGHYKKLVGIPKSPNTILYPYEWRPDAASDELINSEILPRITGDGIAEDFQYSRTGVVSELEYTSKGSEKKKYAEEKFAELPLLNYPGYTAVDENGDIVGISEGEGAVIKIPLSGERGEHRITVTYRAPLIFALAALASFAGTIFPPIYWYVNFLKRKKKKRLQITSSS